MVVVWMKLETRLPTSHWPKRKLDLGGRSFTCRGKSAWGNASWNHMKNKQRNTNGVRDLRREASDQRVFISGYYTPSTPLAMEDAVRSDPEKLLCRKNTAELIMRASF